MILRDDKRGERNDVRIIAYPVVMRRQEFPGEEVRTNSYKNPIRTFNHEVRHIS
jgi:hypothetical protein